MRRNVPTVFLSYTKSDRDTVSKLYKKLTEVGFKPWMDQQDLKGGEEWESKIKAAIRACNYFIACLSKDSLNKQGVIQKELRLALEVRKEIPENKIFLIPIRLEECDIPPSLRDIHYVDYFNRDGWPKLLRSLGGPFIPSSKKHPKSLANTQTLTSSEEVPDILDVGRLIEARDIPISNFFVGRNEALNEFYRLFSYRRQKNVLQVIADGGLGKSWLLKKIYEENQDINSFRRVFELIDFYELQHRSVKGVRDAIIERLGEIYFVNYLNAEAEQVEAERSKKTPTVVAAKRESADFQFFEDLNQACSGHEIVLLFDTFEIVQSTEVGRWFIEEFIEKADNLIVVFAGRPVKSGLGTPFRAMPIHLKPFDSIETQEFFERQAERFGFDPETISPTDIEKLRTRPGIDGLPLRLELALNYCMQNDGTLNFEKINEASLSREKVEETLISFIGSEQPGLPARNQILKDMAILKRRFDREVIEYLLKHRKVLYQGYSSYDEIAEALSKELIVKHHPDGSFALHDRVQDLVEKYVLPARFGPRDIVGQELFELIVNDWYVKKIKDSKIGPQQQELFKAERLGYMLDRYPKSLGPQLYDEYFEEIKKQHLFTFNELVLDQMYDHRNDLEQAGYLFFERQGEWLYSQNQFHQSAGIFRRLNNDYSISQDSRWKNLSYQGASYLTQGRMVEARDDVLVFGLNEAVAANNPYWISVFRNYFGIIHDFLGEWSQAQESYRNALDNARQAGNAELECKSLINLGEFTAIVGEYDLAEIYCQNAYNLGKKIRPQLEGEALLALGKVKRYQNHPEEAQRYYEKALSIFRNEPGGHEWVCTTLQGLGINHSLVGYIQRVDHQDYLKAIQQQVLAFSMLNEALNICRQYNLSAYLADNLFRLARVMGEIGELEERLGSAGFSDKDARSKATHLLKQLVNKKIPDEIELPEENLRLAKGQLIPGELFKTLKKARDLFGMAQRFSEISYLEADSRDRIHVCLESLSEAARFALRRQAYGDVLQYIERAEFLKGLDFQEELFLALMEITLANLAYARDDFNTALIKYEEGFLTLANHKGYGLFRFNRQFNELEERIKKLPVQAAKNWCKELIDSWSNQGLDKSHPSIIARLEGIMSYVSMNV